MDDKSPFFPNQDVALTPQQTFVASVADPVLSVTLLSGRKYLPTLSDLVDRFTIIKLKSIFIAEHRREYLEELKLIKHDIRLVGEQLGWKDLDTIIEGTAMTMLCNRYIWENEGKARLGKRGQNRLLKLTHSINGVRNTAKNLLAHLFGERMDWKVDCFAAELVEEFGNWNVFDE